VKNAPDARVKSLIAELGAKLSLNAKILTGEGEAWGVLMERWTDIGKETPGAIVSVATEADVLETVRPLIQYPRLAEIYKVSGPTLHCS